MFEKLIIGGTPEQGIAIQTKLGRQIKNALGFTLNASHTERYRKMRRDSWVSRRPATGVYNCTGHVWAARRTCIYEEVEWRKILEDDDYRNTNHPKPDDLVIYRDSKIGMLHVGRVLDLRPRATWDTENEAWIVSKWCDWSGEDCHFVSDHPYPLNEYDLKIEFWTDRPKGPLL